MFDKFRIKITILASLIITAYCFFANVNFLRACYTIIFTIILFYILGGIAEIKLKQYIDKKKEEAENNTDEEEKENNSEKEDNNKNNTSEGVIINDINDENSFEDDDFYENIDFNDEQESF